MNPQDVVMLVVMIVIMISSIFFIWKALKPQPTPNNPTDTSTHEITNQRIQQPTINRPPRPIPSTLNTRHDGDEIKLGDELNLNLLFESGRAYCKKCGSPLTPENVKIFFELGDGVIEKHYICGSCGNPVLPTYKAEIGFKTPTTVKLKILEMKQAMLEKIKQSNENNQEQSETPRSISELLICRGCPHFDLSGVCKLHNKKGRWNSKICEDRLLELLQAAASGKLKLPQPPTEPAREKEREVNVGVGRVDGNIG